MSDLPRGIPDEKLGKGVYRRANSKYLWIRLHFRGKAIQESTKEVDPGRARAYLKHRQREIGADRLGLKKFIGPTGERLTMADLLDNLKLSFERRSIKSLKQSLSHIKRAKDHFGDVRAHELTAVMVDEWYQEQRALPDAPEVSTLNRAVSMLSSALRLAKHHGRLNQVPTLTKLSEAGRERKGFFEKADFEAVVSHLPDYLKDCARFAYLTGWRSGAIRNLTWADVDLQARTIHMRPEHDKVGRGQTLALEGELWAIVERCSAVKIVENQPKHASTKKAEEETKSPITIGNRRLIKMSEFVFHRNGLHIGDYRKAWATACKLAGCPGRKFHDFRRTAARNMIRAGVSQVVAMSITGHRTVSMFHRYAIVSQDQIREAQAKLQAHLKEQPVERKVVELPAKP